MKKLLMFFLIVTIILANASLSSSQMLGQNKVNDRHFDWMTYKTTHFIIYYYPEAEGLVRVMGDMAEVAYAKISDILEHEIKKQVPLVLYKSHPDFRQTNIVLETLDEGVGGFSELLKYRVVIPFTGSMDEFQKVITHEVDHVFQFDILYRNIFTHIYTGEFLYSPPLWFLEGMSEFMADDWNAEGEMVLKDAVITNSIVPLTQLQDFSPLGSRIYLGYKEGQSAITYLVDKYGIDRLSEMLRELYISRTKDMDETFKNTIGIGLEQFNKDWEEYIKKLYLPEIGVKQNPSSFGKNFTEKSNDYSNVRPIWSPSGDLIAYIAQTDVRSEIRIVSSTDGELFSKLNDTTIGDGYDTIRENGSGLAWSHDGDKLAFIISKNDKDSLYIVDVISGKVTHKAIMPFDVAYSPSWSPDNQKVAFVGMKNGRTDIYTLNIKDNSIVQLTSDYRSKKSVAWHPSEQKLVYSSEHNGKYKLFILDLITLQSSQITYGFQNDVSPSWSPDGKQIIYCSDAKNIYDIYALNVESPDGINTQSITVTKLTNILTGCSTPTLSPKGDRLAMSVFHDYKSDVYILKATEFLNEKVTFSSPEELEELPYAVDDKPLKGVKYGLKFSPDLIFANFGYTSGGALQNSMQFVASDMMGNHRIMASVDAVSLLNQPDIIALYYYLKKRPDFGFAVFNLSEYHIEGGKQFWQRDAGFQTYMSYPLDKFNRFDLSVGRYLRFFDYINNVNDPSRSDSLNMLGISFVRDKVAWSAFGPFIGTYLDVTLEQSVKMTDRDLKLSKIMMESSKYIKLGKRTNLAMRILGAGSLGDNRQNFYLGSSFSQSQSGLAFNKSMMRGYDYNEIFGTRVGLLNLELRIPFIDELRFGWPVAWGLGGIRGVVFMDFAGVWPRPEGATDIYGNEILLKDQFKPWVSDEDGFRLMDLRASVGLGIRLGPLSFDFAKKTNLRSLGKGYKFHFGLGQDF
jgi:Tol biopolymer transport system component